MTAGVLIAAKSSVEQAASFVTHACLMRLAKCSWMPFRRSVLAYCCSMKVSLDVKNQVAARLYFQRP